MHMLPDVQAWRPAVNLKLTRVGIRGVKKPVKIRRKGKENYLLCEMNIFVDLPANRKGSDLSRNAEIVEEIVDKSVRQPYSGLEELCEEVTRKLLERHEYASRAEAFASSIYFLEKKTPLGKRTLEPYRIMARAIANRDEKIKRFIGVEVVGMTACPCAMENIRKVYGEKYTHNQRNIATIFIENNGSVDADDLIEIAESAMSSPTYEILKREDEMEVVKKAHENPKFVEDVVRDILKSIVEKYPDLPDDFIVIARSQSHESIHKHDAFAERVTTIGELKS